MKIEWHGFKFLAILLVLLVAVAGVASAQERAGIASGTVIDASGAVVPDATVTLTHMSTNRSVTVKSRNDGTFYAADLEPGRYNVTVEKQGFSKYESTGVQVLVGRTTTVPAKLTVGGTSEVVEVVGASNIDTASTMISHNVTIEELDRLPKGRNFVGVAVFSPSVNTGQIEGGFQINGASGAENAYYIDGVATNSIIDGSARQAATFDYLQEVQVKTTGLDAEYGGALGGVVSAVTRSGGDAFHGAVNYMYYGNKLASQPVQRLVLNPTVGAGATSSDVKYIQDGKYKRDTHEIGGTLGGPLVKGKMWFFTSAAPRWQIRRNDYRFSNGKDPGSADSRTYQMNWFSKLSWDPSSRIRTNFTYLYTPTYQTGVTYAYNGFAADTISLSKATSNAERRRGFDQPESSVTGQIDFTLTNTSLLSVKGGRYYLNYKDVGVPATWVTRWATSSVGQAGVPTSLQNATGFTTPGAAGTVFDITTRNYIQADFSQLARFGGQHNFKFGVGTQKNINSVNDSAVGPDGRVSLFWNSPLVFGGVNYTGKYGYYTVDDFATRGSTGATITHLYVQDSWRIHSRLTINAGARFEREIIPSFRPDIQKYAFLFGFGDKFSPRLGASFDLLGNGKVKISGGWGRYFDWTKFDLARGTFGGDLWHVFYRTLGTELETAGVLDPAKLYAVNLSNMPGSDAWAPGHNGSTFRDRRVPGFDLLDPGVKPMSTTAYHAGVEWEVVNNMVFTGRYVRNKLDRTIEDLGALDANGDEVYAYGNPGESRFLVFPASGATCVVSVAGACGFPMPKAQRTYDAMELSLARRFSNGWLGNVSYVWSRLYGNYSGLQNTDEIRPPTLGGVYGGNQQLAGQLFRPGGNANRSFDLDEALFDSKGVSGLLGRLPTDRPHVFKFYGAKQFKFGTEVGGFFRAMSGTPVTTQVGTLNQIPMYVNGRGDAGRTPMFNQTDLVVAQEFKIGSGENKKLRFEMNMTNLFNQKTSMFTFDRYNREDRPQSSGIDLSTTDLAAGFDYKAKVLATGDGAGATDPRFGQAAIFNPGFEARFAVKFTF